MSNPDRLQREATEHAEVLIEDRGPVNAIAWANHCMIRDTGGFWRRVHDEIVRQIRASNAKAELDREDDESDPKADRGDWEFHQRHDQ